MPKISDDVRSTSERPGFLRLFESLGVAFCWDGSKEARAEECPFCDGEKFSLNVETGQYCCHSANKCGQTGNAYTFVNHYYEKLLAMTSDADYQRLRDKRGLPLQTLKRHGLAWDAAHGCWLIPYKSKNGTVQNLTRYYPTDGRKLSLSGLPAQPYCIDQLSDDTHRRLLIVEGPWDCIAADQHFRSMKTRTRYDLLAVPSATIFKPEWSQHLSGRDVRICLDNDKAGRDGAKRIVSIVQQQKVPCGLRVLEWPPETPEKYDISDAIRDGVNIADFTREHCVKVSVGETRIAFVRGDAVAREPVSWMWEGRIQFGTFVSLSGQQGTQKSTIARDIIARATSGCPMPLCETGLEPFDVFGFTSEDSASRFCDGVRIHGGDLSRLHVHDIASGLDPVDLLARLEELEATINATRARLVVLDALNSFVGGDISTDSKARRTLSGRLQSLARRTGACIIGIRNWGRMDAGTASQRALGATSLSDVARCVMNTREKPPIDPHDPDSPRRFQLEFEKVSDAPKPASIGFSVKDLSTGPDDSHLRKIIWQKPISDADVVAALSGSRKR